MIERQWRALSKTLFAIAIVSVVVPTASAHPHILANVHVEVVYGKNGALAAVRQSWAYDPAYSAFAMRQADADGNGELSNDELAAFAKQQIGSLAEFGYYTVLEAGGKKAEFAEAADYGFSRDSAGALTLHFTLPVKTKLAGDKGFTVEIFDPQFFAYFTTSEEGAVLLTGAPQTCGSKITSPMPIDLTHTRSIPAVFWAALDGSAVAGQQFVNRIVVSCP